MRPVSVMAALLIILAACSNAPAPTTTSFPTLAPTPTGAATGSPSPTAAVTPSAIPTVSASPSPTANVEAWQVSAVQYFGRIGEEFDFDCTPNGAEFTVWGTDIYTADSSVCTAAVHAGLISFAEGGTVTIEMLEGQEAYEGTTRNGVETRSYPSYSGSFRFAGAGTASPSPSGSPSSSGLTQLFVDDFSDPTSGFAEGENVAGTAAYGDGNFVLTTSQQGAYIWSRRLLNAGPFPVVQAGGQLTANGEGIGGILCGGSDNHLVGMLLTTDGRWYAIEIPAGVSEVTVLDQGTLDETTFEPFSPVLVSGECARIDDELELSLGVGLPPSPVAVFRGDAGPETFALVALYAEALSEDFSMHFDNVAVLAGESGGGLAAQLVRHIPSAFHRQCQETPVPSAESGALVAVACFVQQSGNPGAEIFEYVLFDSTASMDAAYEQRLSSWGAQSTGISCDEGPAQTTYSINGEEIGRVFCGAQTSGIRIDWTDRRLNILTSATDFDSSYADLHKSWVVAGPDL